VNFGPLTPEITRLMFTHHNQIFWKAIFRPLRGAAPQIFTRAREWPSLTNALPTGDGGSPYIFFQRGGGKKSA